MKSIIWKSIYLGKKSILWLVYLIFAFYIGYLVFTVPAFGTKMIFGSIGVLVLSIVLLFEYLKNRYEHMIVALTIECDVTKAKQRKLDLQKKDLFNGFKQSIIIFDSLLLLDEGNYQACLAHLERHQHFFHGTLDYLFIYYHTQMYCYYFLEDQKNMHISLKHLTKLQSANKKQMRGLFSWHEIIGFNYLYQNRNQKCLQELELINQHTLNNRELTYLLYVKGQCLLKLEQKSEGYRLLKEAKVLGNTLAIAQVM